MLLRAFEASASMYKSAKEALTAHHHRKALEQEAAKARVKIESAQVLVSHLGALCGQVLQTASAAFTVTH
jgi:hypothetical protein